MFHFPPFAHTDYEFICVYWYRYQWVAPFGNLRIDGRLRLPEAYRSLPRPSSPDSA